MTDRSRPARNADSSPASNPANDAAEEAARHCRMLPHPAPSNEERRLLLFAFRRMAQHGLRDAIAAERMLGRYGVHYRGPLVLLRAFVLELAQSGERNIAIAHCCMPRMTADEAAILDILASPAASRNRLAALMGGADPAHAQQIAGCLSDKLAAAQA